MEEMLPELRNFINNFCNKNKIGRKSLQNLSLDTSIYPELNLSDLYLDMFLSDFIEKFHIDYSSFHWKKYGYPEGYILIDFLRLFVYSKPWVKRIADHIYKPKFFVRNLQEAILKGKLE